MDNICALHNNIFLPKQYQINPKISEKQLIELGDIIEGKGYKIKPVLSQYCIKIVKINKIEDLPVSKFESAKDFFDAMDAKE